MTNEYVGIILAGGTGSRLYPLTKSISKQLLPIYNKPMIYYSLSVLMLAKIREILIITTPSDSIHFKNLLGDGSNFGVNLKYKVQNKPNGIAEAFILGEKFIGKKNVCLVLGDNFFYGKDLVKILNECTKRKTGASIVAHYVKDAKNFGVVNIVKNKPVSIEEKPKKPKSNFAIVGLYFYDNKVLKYAKKIKPSRRGELEITDINKIYLKNKKLNIRVLGRGFNWYDNGTQDALLETSNLVKLIETKQGLMVGCLEEIAYKNSWINAKMLKSIINKLKMGQYKTYLSNILHANN